MISSRAIGLWAPVVVYVVVLYVLSDQSTVPGLPFRWDKILHIVAFAGLGLLALRAFHGGQLRLEWGATAAAVALTIGYGAVDEFHQSFVQGRDSSVGDVVADGGGALVAVAIFGWIVHRVRVRGSER